MVAIDFETANEQRNSACALGIALISSNKISENQSWLIKPPELRFNSINVGIHGITQEDVSDQPTFDQLWPTILNYIDNKILIAHNASFDISVLRKVLEFYGIPFPNIEYYCTCIMSRKVWPSLDNHKLATVTKHLGITFKHHNAAEDALACYKIAIECCIANNVNDIKSLAKMYGIGSKTMGLQKRTARKEQAYDHSQDRKRYDLSSPEENTTMSEIDEVTVSYTRSGLPRYEITISHKGLNRIQVVKSDDPDVAKQKAMAKLYQWEEMWIRREVAERARTEKEEKAAKIEDCNQIAIERTRNAEEQLDDLNQILIHTLDIDDTIDWESLKNYSEFPTSRPQQPDLPRKPTSLSIPDKPLPSDEVYQPKFGLLDKVISSKREDKIKAASLQYKLDVDNWKSYKKRIIEVYNTQVRTHNDKIKLLEKQWQTAVIDWECSRKNYIAERDTRNSAIEDKKKKYLSGAPEAIRDYCDMVLSNSEYPDYFPKTYDIDYKSENKLLIVEYDLPSPDDLPTLKEVNFVKTKKEFSEKHITSLQKNKLYDEVLYQIALRTIHELFEADSVTTIDTIVFNGLVRSIDKATGKETHGCVLSLQVNKQEFEQINLARIDPKACFKSLKGVGSSKLHSITPIAPIITLDKDDKRFVDSYNVVDSIDASDNLAAIDWEDFEHLIRELFEKHFAEGGGEVRVTRASRDGGVDAIVYDPDPIRGGMIAIQAKRYTNTVGVSAVRDLYGTVMNEGANKGILVTTSNYGPDAYEFAKGKPLTLLDGGHLLHLLQSHGYNARIDLKEAKTMLKDRS